MDANIGINILQFTHVCSDDAVEVGADLYEIDTEAEASVQASESVANESAPADGTGSAKTDEAAKPKGETKTLETPSSEQLQDHHRVASIKFLGKEGWAQAMSGQKPDASSSSSPSTISQIFQLPPMYGRPQFSEEEMEALILGGASLAPNVMAPSGGAKFQY
jgi:pyruvate/2-oxoglutarate dehydrogenase complex dihydrolipoamide acyltransferase (E2) component